MRRSILSALSLPWTVLGQTHLLCPAQAASGNLVANPSFEASNPVDQWTPQQAMFYGSGKFNPADGSTYFIIPVGGITGSGTLQQNVTVERDTRYYGSIKVRPRVPNPTAAQSTPPRTCTATAALQGAIGGTFQDTATFFIRPDAVFDWETLGFDFKNPFTGSVRFIMTTSCDGSMPSLEMDFDDALVQQLDGGDLCSSPERPVPITGNVVPVPPTSESTTFVTSTGYPSSSSVTRSSTTDAPATTDPAVSTVQVTITAAPVTTTTYTTVFVTQTATSTVTVYASTVSATVTVTEAVATTTVTAQVTATQPARLRRRGCKQHTASNSATSSAISTAEPSYNAASSSATSYASVTTSISASSSNAASASSGSASSTITSATASPSSTVAITSTTTVTTTVTPTVIVDGGSTTVNVPAGPTTITEPITTVTATATSSVTSTVSTTVTVV